VVISGCGHAGIVNTTGYSHAIVRSAPIHAVIGGLHLFPANDSTLSWTATAFREFGVRYLLSAHCTGIEASYRLRDLAGLTRQTAVVSAVGSSFTLADTGYKQSISVIKKWLSDEHPNVRRAVIEGLRIWTSRPYFRDHPDIAVRLLSQLYDDESEYVRRSVGNALRDISRKHQQLVSAELRKWNLSNKAVALTRNLASKFL
jgi:3-methyladenine DNA glycosylase AlkC